MAGLTRRVDGIDVYESNNVNWPGVTDLNVLVGMAKAWHETDTGDGKFRNFWPAMRDAGLIRGAYLLIKPERNLSRADIESLVQHFTDRIDEVGGLEPGDLPPIVDYEGGLPLPGTAIATRRRKALDQLAWALHKLIPYTQQALRNPDALPMVYTGRAIWMDSDALDDPAAAYVTSDANPADQVHVDFSLFPFWWSDVHHDVQTGPTTWRIPDPLKAADLALVPYPQAWPGPRHFLFQYSGHVPFPDGLGGQPDHDGNVIADVDAANTLSIPTDFSPLLKLASVAPPTSDIELTRVVELSDQPPDQVFSLLLIGQGYWPDEFAEVVNQGLFGHFTLSAPFGGAVQQNVHARTGVGDIAPLNLLFTGGGKNRLACYYDAGTHPDGTGLSLPLRQEGTRLVDPLIADPATNKLPYDSLRISHQPLDPLQVSPAGRTLSEYLSRLTVKLAGGQVRRATDFWPLRERRTGPAGSLIAVLRKGQIHTHYTQTPTDGPRAAEYYKLDPDPDEPVPFVAVNVVPGGDWPLVIARAIAQNLAGLGDEYELEGDGFAQPPEGALTPLAPNILAIKDAERTALTAGASPATVIPQVFAQWAIPAGPLDFIPHTAAGANPIPPWNSGFGGYDIGGFHLVEGGGGFRTHVVRCDRDCLMRRIPAAIADSILPAPAKPPGIPIQSTLRAFCEACQRRIRTVILARTDVKVEPRIEIDSQRRLFDWIPWVDRKELPRATVALATSVSTKEPLWSCSAEFAAPAGFRFTDLRLFNVDYWAPGTPHRSARVLKSVAFDLAVEFSDGSVIPLSIPAALASAAPAPKFEGAIAGDKSKKYQVGGCLSLSWLVTGPAGKTCTIDAELSLVLAGMDNDIDPGGVMVACRIYPQIAMRVRKAQAPQSVKSLRGTITLEANNADPSDLSGTLKTIANGKLTASLFCESNRASVDKRKRAAQGMVDLPGSAPLQPLPYWSWIYDYCRAAISGPVTLAGVYSRSDGAKGANPREFVKAWPPGQNVTSAVIRKLPRQGVYDSLCIHPDHGNDSAGRPIVGAPVCADLGLHLHWRRGVSWTSGPAPAHVFRGWGAGRLDQGARAVLGAPSIPPNQHLDIGVTPAPDRSTVTVKYSVTATEVSQQRWHVFLEQGLAFAFQYAAGTTLPDSWNFGQVGWLAAAVGAGVFEDIGLDLIAASADPSTFDAKLREVWLSILKRARSFDPAVDGSGEQQVPDGPSDSANLENL